MKSLALALALALLLLGGGGYGGGVWFYRLSAHGQVLLEERLLAPRGRRLTVGTVSVESDRLLTVAVHEERDRPLKNQVLVLRSPDLGRSWAETAALDTTMTEDWCRMQGFQWSGLLLGRFTVEDRGRSLSFLRSEDGALSWTATPVELSDELGPGALRLPLDGVQSGELSGLVYLGLARKGAPGKYYFSRSTDQGRSWEPGRPMTAELEIDDVSRDVVLTAGGGLIAFAYVELRREEGSRTLRQKLVLSQSAGLDWSELPLDDPSPLPGTALIEARDDGRSVVLAGARREKEQVEVFVRELSLQ